MTVYEVIDRLRTENHLSIRKIGMLANMPPTTFESIMHRRPEMINAQTLDKVAKVFGKRWYNLLNIAECEFPSKPKVPAIVRETLDKGNVPNKELDAESVLRAFASLIVDELYKRGFQITTTPDEGK